VSVRTHRAEPTNRLDALTPLQIGVGVSIGITVCSGLLGAAALALLGMADPAVAGIFGSIVALALMIVFVLVFAGLLYDQRDRRAKLAAARVVRIESDPIGHLIEPQTLRSTSAVTP
jgi:hypothetical protein